MQDDNESDAADAPREADEEEIEERDDADESTTPDAEDNADEDNEPGPNKTQKKKKKKKLDVFKSVGPLTAEQSAGWVGSKKNPFKQKRRGLKLRGHNSGPPRRTPVALKRGPFFQIDRDPEQAKKDRAAWKAKPKACPVIDVVELEDRAVAREVSRAVSRAVARAVASAVNGTGQAKKAARRADAAGKWGECDIERELAAARVHAKTQARIAEIDERRASERAEAKRRAKAERRAKTGRAEAECVEEEAAARRRNRRALGAAAAAPQPAAAPPLPALPAAPATPVNWFELVGRQPRDESEPCTCDLDPCRCWSL